MTRRVYYNLGDDDEGRETFLFEVDDLHYQTVASNLTSGETWTRRLKRRSRCSAPMSGSVRN